jgi:hypothetical protein
MNPMTPTEEIRSARHKLAVAMDNDLDRIVADLRRKQHESGCEYITLEPRQPIAAGTAMRSSSPSGESGRS